MATTTFDGLAYAQQMEKSDVDRKVAEAQAEILQKTFSQYDEASRKELATKADLQHGLESLRIEITETKHEILKWIIGALIAQTALIAAMIGVVIAYLPK